MNPPVHTFDARRLARAYLRMLPAAAGVWLVAAAPPGPAVREVFLAALTSVFVVAAAARAEGLHPGRNTLGLALDRLVTHAVNLLFLLLFLVLAGAIGGTLGGMVAQATGLPADPVGVLGAALASLPVLAAYWPAAALAVVAPEETGVRPSRWIWRGPGYTSARRLARDFGRPARTALLLGVAYLWLALLLTADAYRGDAPLATLIEAASYAVFLPLLAWMATVETRRLVDRVPSAPDPR